MSALDKVYKNAKRINIDKNTKIVIMSDCHRGKGNNYDNFLKNESIYKAALNYYYKNNYTYVELGDGDDMWEVEDYAEIIDEHIDTFKILKKFNNNGRLVMIYGNHDMCKKSQEILEKYFYKYYNKKTKEEEDLLANLKVDEALILDYKGKELFLTHGHQVDILNYNLWKLSRFLVRNVWKYFEYFGVKDPTSAAKNYGVTKNTEKKLEKWSQKEGKILITGHTHRPTFPKAGKGLYFNDGACIHPNGVTAIEIKNGRISLVKWTYQVKDDNMIFVGREVIEEEEPINSFYS